MRTKDFIYYASAAVLLAVTTQVAHADEVATQTPSVTEGNQYQPATAAEIFGGEAALPATPSSTVSAPVATSEVAKPSAPAVSTSLAPESSFLLSVIPLICWYRNLCVVLYPFPACYR